MFIDCGQTRQNEEERIAQDIAIGLKEMGYDPYVATEEHTSKGVKENIFAKLESLNISFL